MASPLTYRSGVTADGLSPSARLMLDTLAARTSLPGITVTSTHRDPFGNAKVGGAKNSQHIFGNAIDLDVSSLDDKQKAELLEAAVAGGARGVGIYTGGNVIHLDTRADPTTWGANPTAPYAGVRPEQQPAWARPILQRLAAGGGGAIPPPPAMTAVTGSISAAAKQFGINPTLMMAVAKRESDFNPNAKNPSSSATGLFGFIDDTWARVSERYGKQLGMPEGTPPTDPKWAPVMAAALMKENQVVITKLVGREPTEGELYLTHFMGGPQGVRMIQMASATPDAPAAAAFPGEAAANGKVFFDDKGQPRTVAQVYKDLTSFDASSLPATDVAEAPKPETKKDTADAFEAPTIAKQSGAQPALQQLRGPTTAPNELDILSQRIGANRQARGLMG